LKIVYVLQSLKRPRSTYVGITEDLERRLAEHNEGKSRSTARYKPWMVAVSIRFADEKMAEEFERYLKSGSGRSFLKRHFRPSPDSGQPTRVNG